MKSYKLVISDCHLSAGQTYESIRNPHEDFFFDDEMVEFLEFFSSGRYGDGVDVQLIINGDFFDPLVVPYRGEFEEVITEEFAVEKMRIILEGHSKVVEAFRQFVTNPGKTIVYNIGNHDAEFFFQGVRDLFVMSIDPQGRTISDKVWVNDKEPGIIVEGGIYIEHGNQYEAVHLMNYQAPLLTEGLPEPVLNMPWGSFYVLKIVNRFKRERDYVDKVRPIKAMVVWGLFTDFWFTIRFVLTSVFYFVKTRFIYSRTRKSRLMITAQILTEEAQTFLQDLQDAAQKFLDEHPKYHTVIFGHTHLPMHKVYGDGRSYINTGTWTKMINLDFKGLASGNDYRLTFAYIEIDQGKSVASLQQWTGSHRPYKKFMG